MICKRRYPVEAIEDGKNRIHVIDQEQCIKCGTCFDVCPPRLGVVDKIIADPVPLPLPEETRRMVRGD
jgi:F420-non-reducing hydrogenase iron-sulfur subunit